MLAFTLLLLVKVAMQETSLPKRQGQRLFPGGGLRPRAVVSRPEAGSWAITSCCISVSICPQLSLWENNDSGKLRFIVKGCC